MFLLLGLLPFVSPAKSAPQRGKATFYASKYEGRKTTSGEKYDPNELTAAHAYLPLNTYVLVKNLKNGKEVVVKINDRMSKRSPFIIDVSKTAAQKLDIVRAGQGQVRLTKISKKAAMAFLQKENQTT
nr:septal ring lytic transglycosylase RlpA family protein [Rufibacter sp. LB8]